MNFDSLPLSHILSFSEFFLMLRASSSHSEPLRASPSLSELLWASPSFYTHTEFLWVSIRILSFYPHTEFLWVVWVSIRILRIVCSCSQKGKSREEDCGSNMIFSSICLDKNWSTHILLISDSTDFIAKLYSIEKINLVRCSVINLQLEILRIFCIEIMINNTHSST